MSVSKFLPRPWGRAVVASAFGMAAMYMVAGGLGAASLVRAQSASDAGSQSQTDGQDDGPVPFDAVPTEAASPFGGMAVSPTRVELDPSQRSDAISLFNSSTTPVTYRVEIIEFALDESGGYRDLAEGEAATWSAASYVRFSPSQVTLQPGERQRVRVIAAAPADLPRGEYRSHLRFSSIPLVEDVAPDEEEQDEDQSSDDSGVMTLGLSAALQYQVSIPVILRTGELENALEIAAADPGQSEAGQAYLNVLLKRTGAHFALCNGAGRGRSRREAGRDELGCDLGTIEPTHVACGAQWWRTPGACECV